MSGGQSDGDDPLSPYPELLDRARAKRWHVELSWGDEGWVLEVRTVDDADLLVRAVSREPVPFCWRELAALAVAGIARNPYA